MIIRPKLLPWQKKFIQSQAEFNCLSCGRGSGKTHLVSVIALCKLLEKKNVLLITPDFGNVTAVNIPKINELAAIYNIPFKCNAGYKNEYRGARLIFRTNKTITRGLDGIHCLIIDEASLVSDTAFNDATACLRANGDDGQIYCIGTGTHKSHWFAQLCMAEGTNWATASMYDNPYFGKKNIAREEQKYCRLPSDFKQRELYGLHTDTSESNLFANVSWDAPFIDGPTRGGLDIAGNGADYCGAAIIKGNKIIALEKGKFGNDLDEISKWKTMLSNKYNCWDWAHDATGMGHLVNWKDSLRVGFGNSGGPRFANARTRIYFELREQFTKGLCIDPSVKKTFEHEVMIELLCTNIITEKETKKIQLLPKDEVRKALGRSPDLSDALALAITQRPIDHTVTISQHELNKINAQFSS